MAAKITRRTLAKRAGAKRGYLSLRIKLTALVALLLLVVSVFLMLFFPDRMFTVASGWVESRAKGMASVLAVAAAPGLEFGDATELGETLQEVSTVPGVVYAMIAREDGRPLAAWNWSEQTSRPALVMPKGEPDTSVSANVMHVVAAIRAPGGTRGVLVMGFSLDALERERQENVTVVLLVSFIIFLVGVIASYVIGTYLVRPVDRLTAVTERIVLDGDLGQRITISSRDEVGVLAHMFREMVEKLRAIPSTLSGLADSLAKVIDHVTDTTATVSDGTVVVRDRVSDTSAATLEMLTSLRHIGETVSVLHESAERSANSNVQMSAVTDEMQENVRSMVESVSSSTGAIHSLSGSIEDISGNITGLRELIDDASAAMTQVTASIAGVEVNADETSRLSSEVSESAEVGVRAIEATLEGISNIRRSSEDVAKVIENLGARIIDIGDMLGVIDEVADRTNLLALNAAITAAQAGEHGRGFGVVADEIKTLAANTAKSTQQIGAVIDTIRKESQNALTAMSAGTQRVAEGERLGEEAAATLRRIFGLARQASVSVRHIADATVEQSTATQRISESIGAIVGRVQDIDEASSRINTEASSIRKTTQDMERRTQQVMTSTEEHARGSGQIGESVAKISRMVARVNTAHQEQTRTSELTLSAIKTIQDVSDSQASAVKELGLAIEQLRGRADQLLAALNQFTV